MTDLDTAGWKATGEAARGLLLGQICPVCGRGPWKSPLNHAARKHGIGRRAMRDLCELTVSEKVADPELSARIAERTSQIDMSTVNRPGRPRARQQWTRRGAATNTAIISKVNERPEAPAWREKALAAQTPQVRAKQGDLLRRRWAALPPAERRERSAHLRRSAEDLSEQSVTAWDRRGRKPCGTRAAYRRGCRCEACRAAYLAYRRAHG